MSWRVTLLAVIVNAGEETATVTIIHTTPPGRCPGETLPDGTRLFVQVSDAASFFNVNTLRALPTDSARPLEAVAAELLSGAQCPAPVAAAKRWRDWFAVILRG